MKKVLKNNSRTVDIQFVSENKFYGLAAHVYGIKGFIVRDAYKNGRFITVGREMTKGQSWNGGYSLQCVIDEFILRYGDVYEFDTYEELFAWLIE